MENLFVGSIITIPNIAEGANIVLSTVEHDDKKYALITSVEGEVNTKELTINSITFNISKSIAISYNKSTGDIMYESNEDVIKELVDKMMKK